MAADMRPRLLDAAGEPRFEVPVDELYGRALRARRRHAAIASGAVAIVVGVLATVLALLPDPGAAPIIAPTPPDAEEADRDEADRDEGSGDDTSDTPTDDAADATTSDDPADAEATAPLEGVEWVVNDSEGLRDQDGHVIWDADGFPTPSVARDGDGGIAYTDAEGLWWLPVDVAEPQLVREGEIGRILEVAVVDGQQVARTTNAGDVLLASGEDAGSELPPRGEERTQGTSITAANGLTATVAGPEVERTNEGMIERVLEPATLTIERDGAVELTVTTGTHYEPLVNLHDFDGRRVVLARAPEEPAMAPESVVALDLACPDCVDGLATTSPAGVALVGPDVDWEGPVQEPREDLLTPMTTDEGVTRLPDGRHLLADVEVAHDGGSLSGDLVVWFSAPVAPRAARDDEHAGSDDAGDHHLRNRDPARLDLEVDDEVEITSVWYDYDEHGLGENRPITHEQFLAAMAGDHEGGVRDNLRTGLWWVTVDEGRVVRLDEQYLP